MASGRNRLWDSTFSRMAGLLSAGAALVSILSFVATRGDGPEPAAAAGLAASEVGRVALAPAADTATSIGDSSSSPPAPPTRTARPSAPPWCTGAWTILLWLRWTARGWWWRGVPGGPA